MLIMAFPNKQKNRLSKGSIPFCIRISLPNDALIIISCNKLKKVITINRILSTNLMETAAYFLGSIAERFLRMKYMNTDIGVMIKTVVQLSDLLPNLSGPFNP